MAGLHIPAVQSLIHLTAALVASHYSRRGVILKPRSKWQPPGFDSSIPSSNLGSTQFPVLNPFQPEIPTVFPGPCAEPGLTPRGVEMTS